jgi:hypothetical protein
MVITYKFSYQNTRYLCRLLIDLAALYQIKKKHGSTLLLLGVVYKWLNTEPKY